jgi:hypothetical protein
MGASCHEPAAMATFVAATSTSRALGWVRRLVLAIGKSLALRESRQRVHAADGASLLRPGRGPWNWKYVHSIWAL